MSDITILVVDDLADMRSLLGLTLRRSGWKVIEATDGQQAVDIANQELPDVILMDYDMPVMNGLQACRILSSDEATAGIPIIIYTGHSGFNVEEDALASGAKIFLLKPIPPGKLRETIQSVV